MKTFKTEKGTELPLIDFQGKDYLLVAHRLVWFREERPDWAITTEFHLDKVSLFKANILNAEGRVIATAHKVVGSAQARAPFESAETGAIGRALALCGYGTQFTDDFEESDEDLADAPVEKKSHPAVGTIDSYTVNQSVSPTDKCNICHTPLILSKDKKKLFCPNWENTYKGAHTTKDNK